MALRTNHDRNRFAAAWLASALLTACGGGGGTGGDATPVTNGVASGNTAPGVAATFTLQDVEVTPYALWADEVASRPITVKARTKSTGNVTLTLAYFDALVDGTGAQIVKPMFDDGTHGDAVARDGIWTLSFPLELSEPSRLRLYDGLIDSVSIAISASDNDRSPVSPTNSIDARVEVALLSHTLTNSFPARVIDADIQVTDTLVNIVDPRFDEQNIERLMQRVYQQYPADPFDFAVVFHTRTSGDGIPRSIGVKNDVTGINLPVFDHTSEYGSSGRLQQVVFQNAHMLGVEINHEIGHRWAAYLNQPKLNLAIPTGFHWGASNHVGQMGNGPYLLEENGAYRVTNAEYSENFTANPFSTLELYLMGLVRPDEVAPLRFVTDPSVNVTFDSLLNAASTRLVTINDIVDVYGKREPAMAASQNAFTAAFVVVSDEFLSPPEYTLTSFIARYHAGTSLGGKRTGGLFDVLDPPSFGAATGFRATLETTLLN